MREKVDAFMNGLISGGSKSDFSHLDNWGLNYPVDYALHTFQVWYLSDYKVLPDAGGWNDQDLQWRDDMLTLLSVKAYHERRVKSGRGVKDETPKGLAGLRAMVFGNEGKS